MTPLIVIYKEDDTPGTPTAGNTDGIALSGGARTVVKNIRVNAMVDEVSPPNKMAIRCSPMYTTIDNTTINIVGDHKDRWSLALDSGGGPGNFGDWGAPLVIEDPIKSTNTIFWLRARAFSSELPMIDSCCSLEVNCSVTLQ